jgi:sulfoxide reductase catalytic subunit YedY
MVFPDHKLWGDDVPSSQITPQALFSGGRPERLADPTRRRFLAGTALATAGTAFGGLLPRAAYAQDGAKLTTVPGAPRFQTSEQQTPFAKATTYNNFYEFGEEKSDPAQNAHTLHTRPWTVKVSGLVKKPQTVNIDDLIHYRPLESRVYRHRCVEAWSMVIPWDGYSLSEFINFCQPLPSAKYVQFLSDDSRHDMPNLPSGFDWPYSEGLRMDEAMHPLTLLTVGCYGQVLPNQNGAPVRVVIPWKWGYKSAKSIVEFKFTADQPRTLWNELDPEEYGFYSNVNPNISHRWSQAHERRLDGGFPHEVPTQMFNGYGDQVASLYNGMDLTRFY